MQGGERAGPAKTSLSEWQDGLTRAVGDAKWHAWDCEIQAAVNEYNRHLSATAGYLSLDWRTIKAVAWIETGASHPQWRIKPLQIGVQGDPGLWSLLSGNEGGDLIIPPIWKSRLTMSSATTMPSHNIRAGNGYLLMRMANYEYHSVLDRDAKVYEVKVAPRRHHGQDCKTQWERHGSVEDAQSGLESGVRAIPDGAMCVFDVVDRRGRGQFARDRQVAMRGGAQLSPGVTTARCRRGFAV